MRMATKDGSLCPFDQMPKWILRSGKCPKRQLPPTIGVQEMARAILSAEWNSTQVGAVGSPSVDARCQQKGHVGVGDG